MATAQKHTSLRPTGAILGRGIATGTHPSAADLAALPPSLQSMMAGLDYATLPRMDKLGAAPATLYA